MLSLCCRWSCHVTSLEGQRLSEKEHQKVSHEFHRAWLVAMDTDAERSSSLGETFFFCNALWEKLTEDEQIDRERVCDSENKHHSNVFISNVFFFFF